MKLVEAANAYMELNKLAGEPMPVKIAYGIDGQWTNWSGRSNSSRRRRTSC